jgi:ribosomal protein L11 methylase PrmA
MIASRGVRDPASFRDPDGFVYVSPEGDVLRQVNEPFLPAYERLMSSGLYHALVRQKMLVCHEEVALDRAFDPRAARKVIRVDKIPYPSYPYEWSFEQLKDAALLTLQVLQTALRHGFTLKDASAFNVMFVGARPVFIDTLSLTPYVEGQPWSGYGQFCRHFLAPLALMSYRDPRLASLLARFIDGIPLDLAAKLLPNKAKARLGLFLHLVLHARSVAKHAAEARPGRPALPKQRLEQLVQHLTAVVSALGLAEDGGSGWANYYDQTNYTEEAFEQKKTLVSRLIEQCDPRLQFDLGGNTGVFSRLCRAPHRYTVCFDLDPLVVNRAYKISRQASDGDILALLLDLSNPTPALGWDSQERRSWKERARPDLVLALALIHHLAIANNVSLGMLARFFSTLTAQHLVIEFVPKDDSQAQVLLRSRKDIFPDYTREGFEAAFRDHFDIAWSKPLPGSKRWLYLMEKRTKVVH